MLLPIVAIGVLALIALSKSKPAPVVVEKETPKLTTPPKETPISKPVKTPQQAVAETLATGGTVAGALAPLAGGVTAAGIAGSTALVAATAAVGFSITGDAWGAAGGVYGLTTTLQSGGAGAQAGNIGRVLGREIDRSLGGDGTSGTGSVYQVSGFVLGSIVGIAGIYALPIVGQVFALILIVGSIISDIARLQYGQVGMRNDTLTDAINWRTKTMEELRAAVILNQLQGDASRWKAEDDNRLFAIVCYMTMGFIKETNESRRRLWFGRPRGVGQTDASHVKWGADRGYFCDDTSMYEVENQLSLPVLKQFTDIAASDWKAKGQLASNLANYMKAREERRDVWVDMRAHLNYWRNAGAFVCDEIYADSKRDDIRIGLWWYSGSDIANSGKITPYRADI